MIRASQTGQRAGIFEMDFFHNFFYNKHTLVTLEVIFYEICRIFHFDHFYSMFRASQTGPRAEILEIDYFHYFNLF